MGTVPGEAYVSEDLCSGVVLLAGLPKLDWSRVTGQTGDSR